MQLTRQLNDPIGDLFAEFGRFFRTPLGLRPERAGTRTPRDFNLYETDADWRLRVDLPGFAREDVEITLAEGVLTITADRKSDDEGMTANVARSLQLPGDLATARISAILENGVLELTLPKQEPAKPEVTRIEIN